MSTTTPLMLQYLEIKAAHQDAILFFRLGDFYEMFMEDAVVAARILGIALTSRNKGDENAVPLCGVPYHSSENYIAKLIDHGHKVAICEQVEDPKAAKGLVKREVVRVVTPGLITASDTLDPKENNFLAAVCHYQEAYGIAHVDITTGLFRVTQVEDWAQLTSEIASLAPRELLFSEGEDGQQLAQRLAIERAGVMASYLPNWVYEPDRAREQLGAFLDSPTLHAAGCQDLPAAQLAAAAVLYYLQQTQSHKLEHIRTLQTYYSHNYMVLDEATRRNLELTVSLADGRKRGSLLGVMDRTLTAMGGRTLRHWIQYPLIDPEAIVRRQDAVAELLQDSLQRIDLAEALDGVYDLERLTSRIAMASANAKDLVALRASLSRLPRIDDLLAGFQSAYLKCLRGQFDLLPELVASLEQALVDDPPFLLREGGLIRDGYSEPLDELRQIRRDGKSWIAGLEQQERERTGIQTLKVKYNKVFGYFIEVTHRHADRIPEDYQRKQTLTNAERFITPGLKEYEAKVLGAEERLAELEYGLFQELREQAAAAGECLQRNARALADLDVLLALADLAHDADYVRPQIVNGGELQITGGRHPVVETMPLDEAFVPNDLVMDAETEQLLMITGPNMAGKSTFMRQVALLALMSQMGSFVPADEMRIGVLDRIFTRVGASDNLAKGESTFMVEMKETAQILQQATPRSLIVLDEIGRGTSTFDGVSIAWAVAEYLHDNPGVAAKTLFATHYHELTDLALTRERIRNYNVAVKEWNDRIIFLRKIVPGGASRSYGIQVGRLAGLPDSVIQRAKEILRNLEAGEYGHSGAPRLGQGQDQPARKEDAQLALFQPANDELRARLEAADTSRMTPLEALNLVDELQKML